MPKRPPNGDDDYDRAPTVIKWITGAVLAAALGTVAGLALTPQASAAAGGSAFVKLLDKTGHGSGVHIGDGYILTASHVAAESRGLSVVGSDGSTSDATLLWQNEEYDVALMRVSDTSGLASARLDCAPLPVGAEIIAVGNPRDLDDVRMFGRIAGATGTIGPWLEAAPVDLTIVVGMSGGAVLNEAGGVSGIVVGSFNVGGSIMDSDNVGIGVIVPSSVICMLMART